MFKKLTMTFVVATAMTGLVVDLAQAATASAELTRHAIKFQTISSTLIAREAAEGARGRDNERAGDRQRGRNAVDQDDLIAREAAEGARGRDNERAGDRQRGRNKLMDLDDQIARESTEAPRGQDNNRHRRNRGQG